MHELSLNSTIILAGDVAMPRLGLGTYKSKPGSEVEHSVEFALRHGYRLVDTAALYDNEEGVGAGVAASAVPRAEVFLTTKVWNDDQGYESTLAACARSLRALGTDHGELYLIHWPMRSSLESTWRAMEELLASGATRAIGVCNFLAPQLEVLLRIATVPPALNQFEFHPYLQQRSLQTYLAENGIALQAWAPIMRGGVVDVPELVTIASAHGVSPAQVAIRWVLQKGYSAIPKSVHGPRIAENADVFSFALSEAEMETIDALDRGIRLGKDPQTYVW
jgi:diketogulonate reductase-like aldo/keto reductase